MKGSAPGTWRNLEASVAQYFKSHGYEAKTNERVVGRRSGLTHEVDVLARRRDAAGNHLVAIECKAWRSPIEKDVIYKLREVVQDAGLSKGIIVSLGGLRSGARTAAQQANIEVWGPTEIAHHLGEAALAGAPLDVPDVGVGLEVAVTEEAATRTIKQARSGIAGIGAEEITTVVVMWVPAVELQVAATRVRAGLISGREEVVSRWLLYELLGGGLLGVKEAPRPFVDVALEPCALRAQKRSPQVVSQIKRPLYTHRNARSEAAVAARRAALEEVGLPPTTRIFTTEGEVEVFVPFYVAFLRKRGSERLVAVHATSGRRAEVMERSLHGAIDVVRTAVAALDEQTPEVCAVAPPISEQALPAVENPMSGSVTCACGAPMVLRKRRSDGNEFWGCSTFPKCRKTTPLSGR